MADRRLGYRSMSRRGRPKMQSGTCNVCSAPCSSCMHRNAGFTGSKSDESSSDENSHGVLASECSFNERSYGVNALGNTASEARNLVNSNHDTSSSENAESKEIIRSSDRSHGSLLDGSRKDQDSMKLDTCNDHKAKNILGQGKVKEKSGAKSNKDNKNNSLIESSTRSGPMVRKSGENVPSNKADESNTSAMSESESEGVDSEMLELDVKVCDTCGDAGREDLLAICSRCSDGAEHTYCMRVMLKKVPKGDWLCEECKFAEEAEKKKLETKAKRESAVNLNTQSSSKRHMDKFEAAPDSKRLAVEAPTGSPKRSVLPRSSALSRETSFKGLEKPTRKLAHHSSFNSHSSDDSESTRSPDSQLRSPKGSFFKSNSFNSSSSRPKVRTVDDVMLPRQKTGKDNSSLDLKEGFSRNVGKSMSSRCIDVGSSSCYDSKVNGTKQLKDRSIEANPSASTIDQKLISRGRSSSSYAKSPRDLKDLESDGQQGSLTKQARHLSRNRLEDIVASVGDSSTNEKCSSSEAKCKNELANVDGLLRPREVREAGEKSKDAAGNHQTLNIREDINKGNRLRAAVDAALRKKPNFGKSRGLEQSDLPSVSNVDSGCDKALRNMSSKVPVIRDWPVGFKGLPGGHPNLGTDKQTIAVNGTQSLPGADAMAASLSVVPEVHVPSIKPVMRDFPVAAPAVLSTTSAIPEPEYIWQGDLEVEKSRNLSRMHNGMQAYLSTLASPKVVEVVNQFPVILTLNEVPRLSAWPAQFQDLGAKEQHVALFFFAKDIESYEKNYKPLVDNMIQKDLALKGNLEGVELLVFASNQLPRDCQRWNMLYFLWGVFRGRNQSCSNPLKSTPLPASCVLPNMGKASSSRETFHHENPSNRESLTDRTSSRMQLCMEEENAKEGKVCSAIQNEKALSVSYKDCGADEETEEGEIGPSPHLKDEKTSGPRTVNSSDMNQKVDLDDLNKERLCDGPLNKKLKTVTGVETGCSIFRRDTFGNEFASRKSCAGPCEEEKKIINKNPDATERIVFPLVLNDDDEMIDSNPRALGSDNNNKWRKKTTPSMTTMTGVVLPSVAGTTSIEEHRSSSSQKPQDKMVNQEGDAASLSLSLSLSSIEKERQQQQQQQQQNQRSVSRWEHRKKQNVNTPM
ncbi:PREDICTED: uncharacterized protein LOC104744372 isoform X1 [Camelina sativa]|uniref:Uncharacterized protein LOC104744372 isoform X1 n=1 Tax=Camelina sativa TaxID=90675 RepID=A0ABM0VZU0_CAMSA|nr:PREDICTED: uncharacterized protein LOC104744372 isoform X1 [Camelina sativa]